MLDSSAKPSSDPLLAPQWLRCQLPSSQQRTNNKHSQRRVSRSACSHEGEDRSRSSSSHGRAAPYLDERERDFDQLPRSLSQNRVRLDSGIMHTPSGPRMEPSIHHSRSKSARNASNPHLSEILTPESVTGTPTRSSRLADLPSGASSYIRRTPDSSPELPITPTFSKILYTDSTSEFQDDSIQRERLRIEQSKKLIPVLSSCQSVGGQRRPFKGRVNSTGNLIPLQGGGGGGGAISPVLKKDSKSLTLHPWHQNKAKMRPKSDGFVDSRLRQDRADFYRSLRNNSGSGGGGGGGSDRTSVFSPLLNRCTLENQPSSITLDSSNSTIESPDLENALNSGFEEDQGVPPTLEEELWLRQFGWNGCAEASLLTDEEIAEFKAESMRRNVTRNRKKQQENSEQQIKSKIEQFRSYQDSPIGHLCSYDLAVDDDDGLSDPKPT